MVPPESRLEKEVGGVSYSKPAWCISTVDVRTLEHIEDRLNASSMTFSSSVLILRASLLMYLLGLSGLRTLRRGTGFLAVLGSGLKEGESPTVLGLGDMVEETTDSHPRLKYVPCCGVYCAPPVSAVLAVITEERRACGKLTPRLKLLGRIATGGLLAQCELPKEDREIESGRTEAVRCEGLLRFEELRETAELRLEFCLRVWTLSELPVR